MSALHLAMLTAGRSGDEVVIPVPCWLDYPLYARAIGRVPVLVPLTGPDFDIDAATIAAAVTDRTCAVVLSHPANPTGRSYRPEQLDALAAALGQAQRKLGCEVTLIADETHRDFASAGDFRSACHFWDRTLVIYSFGKYHFMQGQRLGYVAASPKHPARKETAQELVRWTRITGTATPTALMQRALPRLLVLRHDPSWLTTWRRRFVEQLSAAGYRVVPPQATMFIYASTPAGLDDFQFITDLAMAGVLALPAPVFHHDGYFRLSLTGSERMLERALPVLEELAR